MMLLPGRRTKPAMPSAETMLLLALMAAAAVLRAWRLPEIPFMHDEFSAIIRTRFSGFRELIEKGIIPDGHPAGIQVFLYYYIRLAGTSEALLKLPFILCGVVSVGLVYLIGKQWFSGTTGLVAAAFVSFLQYPVMYSQLARPYATGLCFSLMMVWFWTRVVFYPRKHNCFDLAGFAVSATLCAYNHHFSMLFAVMVGITGIFFLPRRRMTAYLAAGLTAIVLYLPHLPVTLRQLATGGVEGWLAKPRFDFLFDYLFYIFHFSVFVLLLVAALVSLSLYWYEENPRVKNKFFLISFVWFILPFLTGYLYSVLRSSVLQYSVMIFSFPFLLFLFFGLFKTTRTLHQVIVVSLVTVIVIPSLIVERRHYSLFYKGVYGEIVSETRTALDSLGPSRCLAILDTDREINRYYLDKLDCGGMPFHYLEDVGDRGSLIRFLDTCKQEYLSYGCLSSSARENYPVILEKFPFLVIHKCYFGGDYYLFSRTRPKTPANEYYTDVVNTFEPSHPDWGWIDEKSCTDSMVLAGQKSYFNAAGQEFSPTYTSPLRPMFRTENDLIDVSVDLRTPAVFPGAWLVLTVRSGRKDLKWNAAAVNDFVVPGSKGRAYQSLRVSDLDLRHHGLEFRAFVWNPVGSAYLMDDFRVRVRSGNPVIYGLYRKIDFQ